ncbi:ATP-binding protein [Cytobacillus gottheilii]|uniref:ATP-binding protein n=1 Tax=Cytobacillus gottheilii TaxID=859144 RepID=UPI002494BEA4|nr:ATP-binding protein [Cytobacillus gottheilii]
MEFILLLLVSAIPLIISIAVLFTPKTHITIAMAVFLFLLSSWQMDVSILYANGVLPLETIDLLFRILRGGSIFLMPMMYYFCYHLVQETPSLSHMKGLCNKSILFIMIGFSTIVYLFNFTEAGIETYNLVHAEGISPSHWMPVYGPLNSLFIINTFFIFINTSLLSILSLQIKIKIYRNFYLKLMIAAMFILFNGIMSGFSFFPLFFSSFNSIIAAIILFFGFFQMQSSKIHSMNKELIRQSDLLEAIMNINPNYLLVTSGKNNIVKVNDSFCELFSFKVNDLIGFKFSDFPEVKEILDLNPEQPSKHMDAKGRIRYISWGTRELQQSKTEIYQIYFGIDITEQKRHEQVLLSSEKLKVIGEMAASVAHEIRNPLTTIRGFIQLIKENNSDSNYENILLDEIDRINEVLKELLILSKPEAREQGHAGEIEVYVRDEIRSIHMLFHALALEQNKNIYIDDRLKQDCYIKIDKSHFKQVIINILKNSLEAISKGGKIKMIMDERDGKVRIRIIDNGEGINKQRLSRIGEPYYTSKEKGTGIGLTICFKLMKENSGEMTVKSKEGCGTSVTILLPSHK